MFKKTISIIMLLLMLLAFVACNEDDDDDKDQDQSQSQSQPQNQTQPQNNDAATIQEAQVVVDAFMSAFCRLDLKAMVEETDAQVDYTQMEFLSLDELKSRMLVPFSVFEAIGVPMSEFNSVVDEIFDSYEKYSTYKIVDAKVQGSDVEFTVNVECISLGTMTDIINTSVSRISMENLEAEITLAIMAGGLKMMTGSGSVSDIIKAAVAPVVENVKVEITRSIEQLTPEKGTVKFVVTKVNNEWVISDSNSDVGFLSKVFEKTDAN